MFGDINIGTVALAILVVLILILIVSNIQIVQQSKAYVVERLGAFHAVWGVGLHLKVPFIERVVKKVSLKEQEADQMEQVNDAIRCLQKELQESQKIKTPGQGGMSMK